MTPAFPKRPLRVRATRFPQRDIEVHGLRLRYVDVSPREDAGTLPLLMVHGLSSRIEEYDAMAEALSRRHRVLVVDLPGSGYSDKPDRPYSLRFFEDTLLGFLDAVGVEKAHLAGGSLGGNLVLRLGHREPERFPRLAAWAPAGAWEPLKGLARIARAVSSRFLFWPVIWGQSHFWYEPTWPGRTAAIREAFDHYREVICRGFVRMYWEIAAEQVEKSLFPAAPQIFQPTLIAWGDRDHGLGMGAGVARLCKLMPRAELKVFRGARHSLAAEVPEQLASSVDEFISRPR
jgi:pimeloyl-ACP methyl ester carboxylesterase